MDQATRSDAEGYLQKILSCMDTVSAGTADGLAALDAIVAARRALDELAVLLLACYLREQLCADPPPAKENLLEEYRAVLARLFNVL